MSDVETTRDNAGSQEAANAAPQPAFNQTLPEDLRNEPSLKNFTDAGSLAKSYVHAQRMIGADKIAIPGKSATPEEWRGIYQKLGAPEKPEDYAFEGLDEAAEKQLRQSAFDAGLNQSQANKFVEHIKSRKQSESDSQNSFLEQSTRDTEALLKKEYGQAYDHKMQAAAAAARQLLGNVDIMDNITLADGRQLGNVPEILKMFVNLSEMIGEDKLLGETTEMVMTPAEAKRQQDEVRRLDGPYWDSSHPEHKAYYEESLRLEEYITGG
tara:strand:+ start:1422 stop:2225 length:804 start_codon:yes stop_codon:yes gene_type:complete